MKTTVGEVINKVKDLEKTISELCAYDAARGCNGELDMAIQHLEDYRDMILATKIDI